VIRSFLFLALLLPALLNAQSDDKGRQVVLDAIAALGGSKFSSLQNCVEAGVAYSFYRAQVTGRDIATIYTEYLGKLPEKGLAVQERQAFGKKQDYSVLLLPDQGFEITFRGVRSLADDRWKRYVATTSMNIFYLLRERFNNPKMSYDFVRSDVVSNTQVNIVDVTTPENETTRVYFDYNSNLPIRQERSEWDPIGQQKATEVTDYSKYRGVNGVEWPYVTHRERNGEVIFEIFATRVEIDAKLPPKTFELPPGAQILKQAK
jgi:hypothetical protein